jgi:hypothetical protein
MNEYEIECLFNWLMQNLEGVIRGNNVRTELSIKLRKISGNIKLESSAVKR